MAMNGTYFVEHAANVWTGNPEPPMSSFGLSMLAFLPNAEAATAMAVERSGKRWLRHDRSFKSMWRVAFYVMHLIIKGHARPTIYRIVERYDWSDKGGKKVTKEAVSIEFRAYLYDDNYQPGDEVVPLPMKEIPAGTVLPLQ